MVIFIPVCVSEQTEIEIHYHSACEPQAPGLLCFFNVSVIWYVYFFINDLIANFIQMDALL